MSLLCLNCRGLGKPRAVDNLRLIIEDCKPSLVFLSETKLSVTEMRDFTTILNSFTSVFVDCRGRSGSLAMLWKNNLHVSFLSSAANHIDITVK